MHEGMGEKSPDLAVPNGLSIELHKLGKGLPTLLVSCDSVKWVILIGRLHQIGRKLLQEKAADIDDDQPLTNFAPVHEGPNITGSLSAIVVAIINAHESVSRTLSLRALTQPGSPVRSSDINL